MNSHIYRGSKANSGFTLIELLSAMVLMALVMGLATMSLSQFSQYRDKSGLGFEARINRYLNLERMGGLLEHISDYYVKNNLGKVRPYFVGEREEIRFVSTSSWNETGRNSLNYLVIEEGADSLKALVLYQKPLSEDVFFETSQFPRKDGLSPILIFGGASEIKFEYLGIENMRQLYPAGTTKNFHSNLSWRSQLNSESTGYSPIKVKINVVWPDGTEWPCVVAVKALNYAKRSLMLDGSS